MHRAKIDVPMISAVEEAEAHVRRLILNEGARVRYNRSYGRSGHIKVTFSRMVNDALTDWSYRYGP